MNVYAAMYMTRQLVILIMASHLEPLLPTFPKTGCARFVEQLKINSQKSPDFS